MTIDEAIQHCEEAAKENREYAEDALDRYNLVPNDITKQEHDRCKQCAEEHRQLAEWLKDYKRLLAERRRGEWIECHGWERSSSGAYKCSVCGRYNHVKARHPLDWNRNFCSYCGADMRPKEVKEE